MLPDVLQWDSDFFGVSVGRLSVEAESPIKSVVQAIQSSTFDVVYLFVSNPTSVTLIQYPDFVLPVDVRVVYQRDLVLRQDRALPMPYHGAATSELLELAYACGHESRFRVDERFRMHFRRLYETWMKRSLDRTICDEVFVEVVGAESVGFITVSAKEGCGCVGLLAVSEECRGKGVGGRLLCAAEAWSLANGMSRIRVPTQRSNEIACRFYERSGYDIAETVAVFHAWVDGMPRKKVDAAS